MAESPGDKEKLNKLAYEAQMLQGQGQGLDAQLNALQGTTIQLQAAIDSLKSLKEKGGKATGFVPVGAGVLAPSEVGGKTVLVDVGAGIFAEKTYEDALSFLEERLKEANEAQEKMQVGAMRLSQRLRALDAEARGIISKMRGPAGEE